MKVLCAFWDQCMGTCEALMALTFAFGVVSSCTTFSDKELHEVLSWVDPGENNHDQKNILDFIGSDFNVNRVKSLTI